VFDVVRRAQAATRAEQSRTLKCWRTEQLLLDELEFEWLRLFYIQGSDYVAEHEWWHAPIQTLVNAWRVLEQRTEKSLAVLRLAAEGRADESTPDKIVQGMGKDEQRLRGKRRKALAAVRSDVLGGTVAYAEMERALADRSSKRKSFKEREKDDSFKGLDAGRTPVNINAILFAEGASMPASLGALRKELKAWRAAYDYEQVSD